MKKLEIQKKLRASAVEALQQRGFSVETIEKPRVVSGARLKTTDAKGRTRTIAVRTSYERKVVLLKGIRTGDWLTLSNVNEIVVAVRSLDSPNWAEIFGFKPKILADAFDAVVRWNVQRNPGGAGTGIGRERRGAPVTMVLDELESDPKGLKSNLKAKASWSMTIPVHAENLMLALSSPAPIVPVEKNAGFLERVRREFAELNGVDVAKVKVSFQIGD